VGEEDKLHAVALGGEAKPERITFHPSMPVCSTADHAPAGHQMRRFDLNPRSAEIRHSAGSARRTEIAGRANSKGNGFMVPSGW
jgi:hypothetical protein